MKLSWISVAVVALWLLTGLFGCHEPLAPEPGEFIELRADDDIVIPARALVIANGNDHVVVLRGKPKGQEATWARAVICRVPLWSLPGPKFLTTQPE